MNEANREFSHSSIQRHGMSHGVSHENVALPLISLPVPSAGRNIKRIFFFSQISEKNRRCEAGNGQIGMSRRWPDDYFI